MTPTERMIGVIRVTGDGDHWRSTLVGVISSDYNLAYLPLQWLAASNYTPFTFRQF